MTDLVTWLRQQVADEERMPIAANRSCIEWAQADIAAKRAILDAYTEAIEFYNAPANRHQPAGEVHGLYTALQWLAVPYASSPGYDESWRPA